MRSLLLAVLISAVACLSLAAPSHAASVSITPTSGYQDDIYTVEGEGLRPGLALDINFKSPTGTVFSTAALNKVVVVDADGDFSFDVHPATDFDGERAGVWTVQVCISGTDDCVQTTFKISL